MTTDESRELRIAVAKALGINNPIAGGFWTCPDYPNDRGEAVKLLEELAAAGWYFELSPLLDEGRVVWDCSGYRRVDEGKEGSSRLGNGDTIAEAVCRFYLAAKGCT